MLWLERPFFIYTPSGVSKLTHEGGEVDSFYVAREFIAALRSDPVEPSTQQTGALPPNRVPAILTILIN